MLLESQAHFDVTAKSPKNAAKTNYLPVWQHRQRSKIEGQGTFDAGVYFIRNLPHKPGVSQYEL